MKKIAMWILAVAIALPLAATEWKDVSLMDASCAKKKNALSNPDNHKASCALQCSKAGYGAVVNGKFVKFDKKGNELAKTALKATSKKDHLRATIDGEMKGDEIHVNSLKID